LIAAQHAAARIVALLAGTHVSSEVHSVIEQLPAYAIDSIDCADEEVGGTAGTVLEIGAAVAGAAVAAGVVEGDGNALLAGGSCAIANPAVAETHANEETPHSRFRFILWLYHGFLESRVEPVASKK